MTIEAFDYIESTPELQLSSEEDYIARREEASLRIGQLAAKISRLQGQLDAAILENIQLNHQEVDDLHHLRKQHARRKIDGLSDSLSDVQIQLTETIRRTTAINQKLSWMGVDRHSVARDLQTPTGHDPLGLY